MGNRVKVEDLPKEKLPAVFGRKFLCNKNGSFYCWAYLHNLYIIAIQEISKEYRRQKTNQRSRMGGSARKP